MFANKKVLQHAVFIYMITGDAENRSLKFYNAIRIIYIMETKT
jgi:hypothetical protein